MLSKKQLYEIAKKHKNIHGKPISKLNKQQLEKLVESLKTNSQVGSGIIDSIKNVVDKIKSKLFFPPNKLPGGSRKIFDKYKDNKITSISVRREPLQGSISKFADWISNGKYTEKLKELGYDGAFHLYLIAKLDNGKNLLVEKNERINIKDGNPKKGIDNEEINIDVPELITVNDFFEKTRQMLGDHDFFQYSVDNNNCQKFIKSLLQANGLLTQSAEKFIMQDAKSLMESLPSFASKFAQFVTDTAGKASQIISGQGRKYKRRKTGKKIIKKKA